MDLLSCSPEEYQTFYDGQAESISAANKQYIYKFNDSRFIWALTDILNRREETGPVDPILDVGTQHGQHALCLAALGFKVAAIDVSPVAIEYAEHTADALLPDDRGQVKYTVHNISNPKARYVDKFKTIIAFEVLEHVQDLKQSLKNIYDLLDRGGILYVSVPFEESFPCEDHVRTFDQTSLNQALLDQGFNVDKMSLRPHETGSDSWLFARAVK